MHPNLGIVGPWEAEHVPWLFAFFLAIVWVWTVLEDRAIGRQRKFDLMYAGELLIEAAVPTLLTFILVNRVGPLQVRSYGAMMLLGFIAGLIWVYLDRRRYDIPRRAAIQAPLVGLAGGILGGRIGFVLLKWSDYSSHPQAMMNLWQGGMSWHGGLVGGLLGVYVACRFLKISFARILDLVAPALALAYAIARIGCFLNGCCYGIACDLPWAVTFPQYGPHPPPPVPIHPTQLYACIGTLVFVIPAILLVTRWLRRPFSRFMSFLVFSSALRFVVEYYRRGATAEVFQTLPVFTKAQAASLAIIVVFTIAIIWRERAGSRRQAAD